MLYTLLIIIHVLICVVLALVVLLQSSKGGGLAGAFGGAGGAPQQLLGSRGMTTLLHKLTVYLAVGFFVSSFLLFMIDTSGTPSARSVVGEAAREGDINVPIQEDPLQMPGATSDQAVDPTTDQVPAETPAGQPTEEGTEEATDEGGGN
jgi:preprotein translocase subunit SecG